MTKIARKPRKNGSQNETAMAGSPGIPQPVAQPPKPAGVSVQLVKPGANAVFIAGSFNEWKPEKTPLIHVGSGKWVGDLEVKAGRHEYLFVVDGQWIPDPNAKETVPNPFGGTNSILVVAE